MSYVIVAVVQKVLKPKKKGEVKTTWECPSCLCSNPLTVDRCSSCKFSTGFKTKEKADRTRWNCGACAALNFFPDIICYRCNVPEGFTKNTKAQQLYSKIKNQAKKIKKSKNLPSVFPGPGKSQKNTWACMACGTLNNYPNTACFKCEVPESFKMKKDIDWGTTNNYEFSQDVEGDILKDYDYRLKVDLPTFGGLDLNRLAAQGDTIDENTFYHASAEERVDEVDESNDPDGLDRALDNAFGDGWLSDDERFLGEKFMGDGWLSDQDDDSNPIRREKNTRRDSGAIVASLF